MNLFYYPDIFQEEIILSPDESSHSAKVLRVKIGDRINLVDGKGGFAEGEVIDNHPKKCRLKVSKRSFSEKRKNYQITVAIAPTKNNERFETFLEKSTEIGIDRIIPLLCERSERKTVNPERFNKVLLSAMKQSASAFLPQFDPLTSFKTLIGQAFQAEKYIAHCLDSPGKIHLKQLYSPSNNVLILIGPEGDFSKQEVDQAVAGGFKEISLSGSRLRTETAGIVACQIIDFMNS